jgi:hypothetical protein
MGQETGFLHVSWNRTYGTDASAAGDEGLEDVTQAYVDDWQACLDRRAAKRWGETELQLVRLAVLLIEAEARP